MQILAVALGALLIALTLLDAFETIILPRRVERRVRFTRVYFLTTWRAWKNIAQRAPGVRGREGANRQDQLLSLFGPLALLGLLAIWALALVFGFALTQWGLGSRVHAANGTVHFAGDLYMSGTTFFTLGLGDITPISRAARFVTVAEVATGFTFLALIIGYLPVIFSRFSDRETEITLLDARAGSPPSAVELLRRLGPRDDGTALDAYLRDWERWTAELLESHLSYPMLAFFRSQHERQSWLATLTLILDTSALIVVGIGNDTGTFPARQARLTFAMARHTVGDLCQLLNAPPLLDTPDRLPPAELERLRDTLADAGLPLRDGADGDRQLTAIRALYEPYIAALARLALLALPGWFPDLASADDWETTAWQWERLDVVLAMREHEE